MKNFVAPGNTITGGCAGMWWSAASWLWSELMVGVANYDALSGASVELSVEGVFNLAKTPADLDDAGTVAKAGSPPAS